MPRIPRWAAWTAAGALALLLAGIGLVRWIFDAERVRVTLQERLSTAAGRPVRLGAVDLTLLPRPALDLADVRIDARDGPLLEVARLRLDADLLALLRGRAELGAVRVESPHLRLRVAADGRGNWEALEPATPATSMPPTPWALAGIEIVDGTIDWQDARAGTSARLADLDAEVGPVAPGREFATGLSGRASHGGWIARVQVRTRATVDPAAGEYAARDLRVTTDLERSPYTVRPERLSASAERVAYSTRAQAAAIDALQLEGLGLRVQAAGRATELPAAPVAAGTLAIAPFSPRALLLRLGREAPATTDARVLGTAALAARLDWAAGELRFHELDARLDDSRLRGSVRVRPGTPAAWRFALQIDRLDAERYRSPAALRDTGPVELPLDALRALDAAGTLRIGELRVAGAWAREVVVDFEEAAR